MSLPLLQDVYLSQFSNNDAIEAFIRLNGEMRLLEHYEADNSIKDIKSITLEELRSYSRDSKLHLLILISIALKILGLKLNREMRSAQELIGTMSAIIGISIA